MNKGKKKEEVLKTLTSFSNNLSNSSNKLTQKESNSLFRGLFSFTQHN